MRYHTWSSNLRRRRVAGLRKFLNPSGGYSPFTVMVSGALSGAIGAGLTTPLDVIKTKLQVQSLATTTSVGAAPGAAFFVQYSGFWHAMRSIGVAGGFGGFWVGLGPRMAMYGPSCAISWAAYEGCKDMLSRWRVAGAKREVAGKVIG